MPLSDLWESHDPVDTVDVDSSAEDGEDGAGPEEAKHLKKRLQTANARQAKAVKRAVEQVEAKKPDPEVKTYGQRLQTNFFTHRYQRGSFRKTSCNPSSEASSDVKQQFVRERARCAWSFMCAMKDTIVELFQVRGDVQHVLNTCVADDTSTKLKPPNGSRSIVYTVMNSIQSAQIRFSDGSWDCLFIPTPVKCLLSGKSSSIHKAFTSWLLVSAAGPGEIWKRLGCPGDMLQKCVWRTTVLIGDALKANDGAWKFEQQNRIKALMPGSMGIRIKCCNHQLCLVRKPVVLSIERFWATIVRLGHLLETHSFRRALAAGFVRLLQQDGNFVRILDIHMRKLPFQISTVLFFGHVGGNGNDCNDQQPQRGIGIGQPFFWS